MSNPDTIQTVRYAAEAENRSCSSRTHFPPHPVQPANRSAAPCVSAELAGRAGLLTCSLVAWLMFATSSGSLAATLRLLTPLHGPPGSHATLQGEGFDAAPGLAVKLGAQTATVVSATATAIEFQIPPGAVSGFVELTTGGQTLPFPIRFQVTRLLPGQLVLPAGLSAADYDVAGFGSFVSPAADGSFQIEVPTDAAFVVHAFRDESRSAFAAVVTPVMGQVLIDAASTARALVLSLPGFGIRNGPAADAQLARLNTLPQTTQLASSINAAASQGRDYLNDHQAQALWQQLAAALLAPLKSVPHHARKSPPALRAKDLFLRDLNPDYSANIPATPVSLQSSLVPHTNDPQARARFTLDGENSDNNVDWIIDLFPVDPAAFPNGFDDIAKLTPSDRPRRLSLEPIASGLARAKLEAEKADLPAVAAGWLVDQVAGSLNQEFALNQILLPSRPPGVYVSQAYSGNLWYGTRLFFAQINQADLIESLGADARWQEAFTANLVVAALDVASVFVPADAFVDDPKAVHNLVHTVSVDVSKAVAIIQQSGQWNSRAAYDLLKTATQSLVKGLLSLGIEAVKNSGEEEGFIARLVGRLGRFGSLAAELAAEGIDLFAKVSSIEQAGERSVGLLLPGSLAIERSIMVIGSPFAPRMNSFFPQAGRGGEVLTILGANFGSDTNELNVSFRQFPSTADPTAYSKRIDLQIVDATPTSIAALVPTNGYAEFSNQRAFVVVERGRSNFITSSVSLAPPYYEFQFRPFPSIASVTPNPVRPGGLLELQGEGFDNETAREYEIQIDGVGRGVGQMASDDGSRMSVLLPPALAEGAHQIAIKLRGVTSPSVAFNVQLPVYESTVSSGYGIVVTRADLSNAADGQISVLEAILLAKRQLGREIEQHLPCEFLPEDDPDHCPYQERETDHVGGDEPGNVPGPNDTISFSGGLVFYGTLPPLSDGDRYIFGNMNGSAPSPFVLDGSGVAGGTVGLLLDGNSQLRITSGVLGGGGLVIQNFNGPGVQVRNGTRDVYLEGIVVQDCGGDGFLLEGGVTGVELRDAAATNVTGHGIHITGAGTRFNLVTSSKGRVTFPGIQPYTALVNCGGDGIRVDGGASFNNIIPGTTRNCGGAGLRVLDASFNFFGRTTDELARLFDMVNNHGPGVHIGPKAVGNTFRYLNPIGNGGDGVLLEGPNCVGNVVNRTFAGENRYEGGNDWAIANQGCGIRLTAGAQFNLIGARSASLGEAGTVSGNRDDGVRLEGADTAYNTVNATYLGVLNPYLAAAALKFAGNGGSGISLRDGAHDNIIGDADTDLANAIFHCPQAAIEIAGAGTDRNLVVGNQIGSYLADWVLNADSPEVNFNGVWIHDGPRDNIVGLPGQAITVPRFPGDPFGTPHQGWNAINTCADAGILIENAGGQIGPDGALTGANVIQANHLGELDNGQFAPHGLGAGVKLGPGALGNRIGGPLPELGNRIRGWFRAGIWIDRNQLAAPELRNRVENNFIEGPGLGIAFRFNDYLTQTPSGGIGVLISDSSGHPVGESQITRNTVFTERLGIYLADSSSNTLRGFLVTNSYNAGIVVRGGARNTIGGQPPGEANTVSVFGFPNEPAWAGVALSHTRSNHVQGNEIGYAQSFRGASGLLLTNAADNEIGGAWNRLGNVIISNLTHGVFIRGPDSAGNRLFNNRVGRDRAGKARPNTGDGVRIDTGAHDNFIGGLAEHATVVGRALLVTSVPFGNTIADNLQAGVHVSGAASLGNRILHNSITGNGGKGILLDTGGNHLQPPPVLLTFDGATLAGKVDDVSVTPPGSLVQLFTDPDPLAPEGDAFLAQATVQSNGTWQAALARPLIHPFISLTATHGVDGSTSEFGVGDPQNIRLEFHVARTDAAGEATVAAGAGSAPVFLVSLHAVNASVRVRSVAFDASGSLSDPAAVTSARLYEDSDASGTVTAPDVPLGGPLVFNADDGQLNFTNVDAVVPGNFTQRWVLAFQMSPSAPVGAKFQLALASADVVNAEFVNPIGLKAQPQGPFAIKSAEFTVTAAAAGQTFAGWAASRFTPAQLADPQISGPEADPDGDRLSNLLEYAFNLNPLLADRDTSPTGDGGIPHAALVRMFDALTQTEQDFLTITAVQRKAPADVTYTAQHSLDLVSWADALAEPPLLVQFERADVGNDDTLERVTWRTARPVGESFVRFFRVRVALNP